MTIGVDSTPRKTYRAAKYIRSSCLDDEVLQRDTIANQSKFIDSFLEKNPDIILVSERIDENYSGLFFDRPAFNEMMQDIENGIVDCILIKDFSRLGRDYIETGRYIREVFPAYGVRLISINDNIDTLKDDCSKNMMVSLTNLINDSYSRDISVKTKLALDVRRKRGEYLSATAIYGYNKSYENKHKLVPDSYAADIVKSIFEMKLNGMSADKIATELNNQGVLSPLAYKQEQSAKKSKWCATTIIRILKDENYTGTLVQGRYSSYNYKMKDIIKTPADQWIKTKDAHIPIISLHVFKAVQRVFLLDTRTPPNKQNVHLFSGLLFCDCCGIRMDRKTAPYKDMKYIYYSCLKGKRNGCCSPGAIMDGDLTSKAIDLIQKRLRIIKRFNFRNEQIFELSQKRQATTIFDLEKTLEQNILFESRLLDTLDDKVITTEDYEHYKKYYTEKIHRIKCAIRKQKENLYDVDLWSEWFGFCEYIKEVQEIDRAVVVQMVHHINIATSGEIQIQFNYQNEFDLILKLPGTEEV